MKDAVEEAKRRHRSFRGASTITMQTAKNLYLFTDRSYVRKVLEVPLAYLLTLFWPKQRVIEVYLNIAQWGPGIFGAEAASQNYFHKSAAELTRREALLLRGGAAEPALAQSGQAEPQNAQDRQVGGAENADPRRALVLRRPADQPPIGLWPAPGLATITALTQNARGAPAGNFKGWIMAVPKRKPPA